jgi:hypothetical protein
MNHNFMGVPPVSHQIAPEFNNFSAASHSIDDAATIHNQPSQRQVESQSTHSNSPQPPPGVVGDHVHNL